jgi:Ca2+-binding RTX toxin-like protein
MTIIKDDKTIYFAMDDLDNPVSPPIPTDSESRAAALRAYVSNFLMFANDSRKNLTDIALEQIADEGIEEIAEEINRNVAASPAFQLEFAKLNNIERIGLKWEYFARNSESGAAVTAYCSAVAAGQHAAIDDALESATDSTALMRSAKKLGWVLGHTMLIWETANAIQDGKNSPDGMLGKLTGIGLGWLAGDLLLGGIGGVAALAGAPVWAVGAVIGGVLVAGYAATKFGEYLWDDYLSDTFWDALDSVGWKETGKQILGWISDTVGDIVPGDPESAEYKSVKIYGGTVIAANPKENIVVGNAGANEIDLAFGRTVAFGKGGNDVYKISPTASGNQVISDTEGDNQLIFGVEGLEHVQFTAVGSRIFESTGGYYRATLIGEPGTGALVISSNYYPTVTLLGWTAGGFGIQLPGFETPSPGPLNPMTSGDDLFGLGGSNSGNDRVSGGDGSDGLAGGTGDDVLDGGSGNDLIVGGSGNDHLFGGDGNDNIFDGSDLMTLRDWDDQDVGPDGKTQLARINEKIAGLGSAVIAKGRGWYIQELPNGNRLTVTRDSDSTDPNASPSGDDVIDAGAGDDWVFAGEGDDVVRGGIGNDYLVGEKKHRKT